MKNNSIALVLGGLFLPKSLDLVKNMPESAEFLRKHGDKTGE